jgi:methyltransferase (TIGR00027 family)
MEKNDTPISNVSDTSFWVAYYRAQETDRPDALFKDPLAKVLVGQFGQKIVDSMPAISKYTSWSVISRTVIIDRFIHDLIKEGIDTVINLGAGLDTRPYRMNLPAELEWIEVDYPNIISRKNDLLKAEKPRCKLTRVELDLADGEKRRGFLTKVSPPSKKILVLTEGVIPYLSPEQVAELATELRSQSRFKYWIAEYFHQRVYKYLKDTVRVAKMRNAPFLFYPDDWFGFFEKVGWVQKDIRYTGDIAVEFKRMPPMPWFARLMMPLLPKKVKQEANHMTGYVIFQPKS